jgi:phenylalanyl-tRNA synthetase beta chain
MTLDRIMAEHPKGKEYGQLVAGLPACPILADAEGAVLSFPPVINSRETGEVVVGDDHLFVEATGPDMRQLLLAMNIMAANFADRGWVVEPVLTRLPYDSEFGREVTAPCMINEPLTVNTGTFSVAVGDAFSFEEIAAGLRRYGVDVAEAEAPSGRKSGSGPLISAACPPWRDDYLHPMDVVEDFAISRGFDSFDPVMPSQFTVGKLKPVTLFIDRVRSHMTGLGFEEIFSNILSNRETEREKMGIPDDPIITIDNVMSETYSVLRSDVLPSLLRVEAGSSKALYPHRLFEAGEVCAPDPRADGGSRTENRVAALWASAGTGFSEIHSVLDMLLYFLVKPYSLRPAGFPFYFEGRAGEVLVDGGVAGHIGEVHPAVLTRFGITMPCAAFEISLDALLR